MSSLSPVTFHGDTVYYVEKDGEPLTPVRPIVENMGLVWAAQTVKLNAHKKRWGVSIIETVAQDGKRRETLCMPVRKLPAFLNSINPQKVRPELRAKIELYQDECDDALWNYWTKGVAVRKPLDLAPFLPPQRYLSPASRRRLTSLVDAKIADVPSHHVWRARMRVWISLKRRFSIPQYRLLPEERLPDAIAFISSLEIGPHGKVVTDDQQALPMRSTDDMRQVASALTHLIAQAESLLPRLQTATPEVCA